MPFKDYKGNLQEAMTKLVGDLKKFGYSQHKTLKVELLKQGYGDQVCHIIDELLNLELYRREFQFLQPKFPPDEEELEGSDQEDQTDQNDSIIMINGGQIEAREFRDSPNVVRKGGRNELIEETKVNFYDPGQYVGGGLEVEENEDV